MATAILPMVWRGRSGREYYPVEGGRLRHGGMATVRKVTGRGGSVGTSTVDDGVALALKLWHEGDEGSLDQLQAESRILVELCARGGELPCPRLYDLVGNPLVTGLVMEWCPVDLERWWKDKLKEPDAFGRLMAVLSETCGRVGEYHAFFASRRMQMAHGDLKPSNILMAQSGRWLISDFGAARTQIPGDDQWAVSRMLVGTENFTAPEAVFNARRSHPAATDTWAIGSTLFALLRMKRMIEDGAQVPRNGTHSPRFRTERMNRVIEAFGHDPTRFVDRDLDPTVFKDPNRLPDEDRRSIRDCLNGVFGTPDERREDKLAEGVYEVMDRCLAIDPAQRYTDAESLAGGFEKLLRTYLALAQQAPGAPVSSVAPPPPDPDEGLKLERDDAVRRANQLESRLAELADELAVVKARPAPVAPPIVLPPVLSPDEESTGLHDALLVEISQMAANQWRPPIWWSVAFVLLILLQSATLLLLAISLTISVL